MNSLECPGCQQWQLKDDDLYCSFCGRMYVNIDIAPTEVLLISEMAPQKTVTLTNSGRNENHIQILCEGGVPDFLTIQPDQFVVRGGEQTTVIIMLDENRMPEAFIEQAYRFVFVINKDEKKCMQLPVNIKCGPQPMLVTKKIDFHDIKAGENNRQFLELANVGAIPLSLKAINPRECKHLKVAAPSPLPIKIEGGGRIQIPVYWDASHNSSDAPLDRIGFELQFDNYKKTLFVPAKARIVQTRIEADKNDIVIEDALSKQDYNQKIWLTNTGNTDLEISKIESDADWITCLSRDNTFTLVCRESSRKGLRGPTIYEEYDFNILIRPQNLDAGWCEGTVMIHTAQQDVTLNINIRINVIKPIEFHDFIGIDFGTTNSVIAILQDGEPALVKVQDLKGNKSHPLIPSVLAFEGRHDNYMIGRRAEAIASAYPENAVRSIKRVMGYGNIRKFFGRAFTPNELAGCIIKKLRELAETEYFNMTGGRYYDIKHAIVTVPANFYDLQIRGILEACEDAGLDTEKENVRKMAMALKERVGENVQEGVILDEPTAAAIYYLDVLRNDKEINKKFKKQHNVHFVVFDYGGGTLDVSIVQVGNQGAGLRVLANKGNNRLGGDTVDVIIIKEVLSRIKSEPETQKSYEDFDDTLIAMGFKALAKRRAAEKWSDDAWRYVIGARQKWKKTAEKVKTDLSATEEATFITDEFFRIQEGEIQELYQKYETTITRYQFNGLISHILNDCERLIKDSLALAGVSTNSVDYILHTGRSSLIPAVRERVKEVFPALPENRDILKEKHLKKCVAMGAAMYGSARRMLGSDIHILADGRKLPHSYGIAKAKGLRRQFEEIIPLGSSYPTENQKEYGKEMIRGPKLYLTFFQNTGKNLEINPQNEDIRKIGEITITIPDDKPNCEVRFVIDANRKLDVYANGEPVDIQPESLKEEAGWEG